MTIFKSNNKLVKNKKQILDRGSSLPSDDYDDWESRYMMRTDFDDFGDKHSEVWGQKGWFKPSCVPISIILVLIVLVVLLPLLDHADRQAQAALKVDWDLLHRCQAQCKFSLVESIPDGMSYRNGTTPFPSTFQVWLDLLAKATSTVEIASYYWTLTDGAKAKFPTGGQGKKIFDELLRAGTERKLTLKIAQNYPSKSQPNIDSEILEQEKAAEVRSLNFPRLVGSGILHTKLWLIDRLHAYIGSANSDWRSLTEVKEMGIYVQDCPCIAQDIGKLFDVYWLMGVPGAQVPAQWPDSLSTQYNVDTPMNLSTNGQFYLSSSPPVFCPKGRTADGDSINATIHKANKFVYIAVMDYSPTLIYTPKPKYWALIDTALRTVALNKGVEVRLLISWWPHSREDEKVYLRSLVELSRISGINITVVNPGFGYSETHKEALSPMSEWRLGFIVENHFLNNWRQGKFKEEKIKIAKDTRMRFKFLTNDHVVAVSRKTIEIFCVRNFPFKRAIEPIPNSSMNSGIDKSNDNLIVICKENVKVYQLNFCTKQWNVKHTLVTDLYEGVVCINDMDITNYHLKRNAFQRVKFVIVKHYFVFLQVEANSTMYIWNIESGVKEKEEMLPIENFEFGYIICAKTNLVIIVKLSQNDDHFYYAYDLSEYVFLPFEQKIQKICPFNIDHCVFGDHIAIWSDCKLNIYNYRTNETKLSDYRLDMLYMKPFGGDAIFLQNYALKVFRCSTGEITDLLHEVQSFEILSDKLMLLKKKLLKGKRSPLVLYEVETNTLRKSSWSIFEFGDYSFNQYTSRYIKASRYEYLHVYHFW